MFTTTQDDLAKGIKPWLIAHKTYRKLLEATAWVLLISLLWSFDLLTKFDDRMKFGVGLSDFRLIAEQITSGLAVAIMLLFLQYWTRWFYPSRENWLKFSAGLVAGSFVFAFGHYTLMVIMRALSYPWFDEQFVLTNMWWNLWFEYRKDVKIYLIASVIMWLYRQWLLQPTYVVKVAEGPPRLKIDLGTSQKSVSVSDISFFEAAKNYVVVVLKDGTEGLIRDTLSNVLGISEVHGFLRVHRSYVVNLSQIINVKTQNGQYYLNVNGDKTIPVSRSYKEALSKKLDSLRCSQT